MIIDSTLEQDYIDHEQLVRELSEVAEFVRLDVGNGEVLIVLDDAAEQEAIDELLSISAVHEPGALHVKIWRYAHSDGSVSLLDPPHGVDYITQIDTRLHPTNSIVVDGEVRRTDYYAQASAPNAQGVVTYSDLVVREDFVYTRDVIGFARARTQTITWMREDDSEHPDTKTRLKYYENDESMREGQRRRSNITDTLAMEMSGWLVATQTQVTSLQGRIDLGRAFMREYKLSFDMFTQSSSAQILYDVRDDTTTAWLDSLLAPGVTIRATILDRLNIWNLTL